MKTIRLLAPGIPTAGTELRMTAVLLWLCCAVGPLAVAAETPRDISVEWAYLAAYPEANCTKIHVYVKNSGSKPVFLDSIRLNEQFLNLDVSGQEAMKMIEADILGGSVLPAAKAQDSSGRARTVQWYRALPNPVQPGSVTDVTVSLHGAVKEAALNIRSHGADQVSCNLKEETLPLRLSQIAFDPVNPNKIYVYCENRTDKAIAVDHLLVNSEQVVISKSIPAGNSIEAGQKACFIVYPKHEMLWGKYAGIGVVGQAGEEVVAVVPVMNYFPIGAWDVDTRHELFFDSLDLRDTRDLRQDASTKDPIDLMINGIIQNERLTHKAYWNGRDPTCDSKGWEQNAQDIIKDMLALQASAPHTPYFTYICQAQNEAYAYFSDLADVTFVSPYSITSVGPEENGRLVKLLRTYNDPKPVMSRSQAFVSDKATRQLMPDEFSFAVWSGIAEGAKGVRYFTRSSYSALPGIEKQIARDNLVLQLLKPFLRIADTADLASTESDKLLCKTILCGDKGIVLIVFNQDFVRGGKGVPRWNPIKKAKVKVREPAGMTVEGVFHADVGFAAIEASHTEGSVVFEIPSVVTSEAYLLLFANAAKDDAPKPDAAAEPEATFPTLGQAKEWYDSQLQRLSLPLLDPDALLDDPTILGIGLQLASIGETMRQGIMESQDPAMAGNKTRQIDFACAAGDLYLNAGMLSELYDWWQRWETKLPESAKATVGLHLADILCTDARYAQACEMLEQVLNSITDRKPRGPLIEALARINEKNLHDYEHAASWLTIKMKENRVEAGTSEFVGQELHLAALLLASGKPRDAITRLRKLAAAQPNNVIIDYLLGMALVKSGSLDEGCKHLRRVVQNKHEYSDRALFMIGNAYLQQGKYKEARKAYDTIVSDYPESTYADRAKILSDKLGKTAGTQ